MKVLIFIVFILLSTKVLPQSYSEINVPEVHESQRVDSLLNIRFRSPVPKNACFIIEFRPYDKDHPVFYLTLALTDLSVINLYGHYNNLRYSTYRNYFVFVMGPEDPYGFFARTNKQRKFKFITAFTPNTEYFRNYRGFGFYIYKNDKFQPIGAHNVLY